MEGKCASVHEAEASLKLQVPADGGERLLLAGKKRGGVERGSVQSKCYASAHINEQKYPQGEERTLLIRRPRTVSAFVNALCRHGAYIF